MLGRVSSDLKIEPSNIDAFASRRRLAFMFTSLLLLTVLITFVDNVEAAERNARNGKRAKVPQDPAVRRARSASYLRRGWCFSVNCLDSAINCCKSNWWCSRQFLKSTFSNSCSWELSCCSWEVSCCGWEVSCCGWTISCCCNSSPTCSSLLKTRHSNRENPKKRFKRHVIFLPLASPCSCYKSANHF